ncbi:MerR family transcriptional regulator [Nitrospirillum iridis]|uniref:DNA-binding transcriptional MerR regulator n=1 Tax=Nitrospirillum iridis TaxID=765888 RepID=A0A7X0AX39_9PROT|nr:MerR family transcriptional regulator [Nitrospirillum iridis]MBB6250269.1 DNA-binding transcriptional MerR regulator [Nitrospirillum iridis]
MSGTPAPEPLTAGDGLTSDGLPDDGIPEVGGAGGGEDGAEFDTVDAGAPPVDRGRGKSPTAFRTISEVSSELDVPQHVLRFWETKFPHIRPLKRGGGRRYYRPDDVELLRRIQVLLYKEGYTIKGVQRLLRTGSARMSPAADDGVEATAATLSAEEPDATASLEGESASPPTALPSAPGPRPEDKLRIIGLFDHDPEADPEWARTPPTPLEAVSAPARSPEAARRVVTEKVERGLPTAKREALALVLADLEEIRDLLRRVL